MFAAVKFPLNSLEYCLNRFYNTLSEDITLVVGDVTFNVPAGEMCQNQTVDRNE